MEWIKIEDETPKVGDEVIARGVWGSCIGGDDDGDYTIGLGTWTAPCEYGEAKGSYVQMMAAYYESYLDKVTHWMPAPKPPIKGE